MGLQLHDEDGCFHFENSSGRRIDGQYGPEWWQPSSLMLFTLVTDPEGKPSAVARQYHVGGMLGPVELAELGEEIEQQAAAKERGEPDAADVQQIDLTGSPRRVSKP